MRIHHRMSRRHMLALSAAAGGLAIAGARAQAAKRIEQFDPALDKIIDSAQPIKELAIGFRVSADLATLTLLVSDFIVPNGLAFSPDESILYINDSRRGHIRAFDMAPNGTLARQTDRVFADLRGAEPGVPDGMKVDVAGNVYCGGSGGLYILDSHGKKLGRTVPRQPPPPTPRSRGGVGKTLFC